MTKSPTLKSAPKTRKKIIAPRFAPPGSLERTDRDCKKIVFRVSDSIYEAAEKWVKLEGFASIATAGRVAIIRCLRKEGLLKANGH